MKKFILLAAVPVFLFSCKKDAGTKTPDPVTESGLEAFYKFSSSYNDETGKSTSVTFGTTSFTADRKGNAASALQLDGGSKLTLEKILHKPNSSVSVWIAKDEMTTPLAYFFTGGPLCFTQKAEQVNGVVSVGPTSSVVAECPDLNWHHYVLMYNGTDITLYKDGVLAGVTNHPGTINEGLKTIVLGYNNGLYWKGKIDDIRFYSRLLTVAEISQLSKE